jgi:O-antigen ligase
MVATVGLRIHETIPHLGLIRPAALATYGGGVVLLSKSSRAAIRSAFQDPTARLAFGYFAWMWVTIPFSLWKGQAFQTAMVGIPASFMMLALLLCSPSRQSLRSVVLGFCVAASLLGALTLVTGSSVGGAEDRLTQGGTLDPNDLAAVMALTLPFALGVLRRERGRYRLMGAGLVLLSTVVVVRTGSRGGTLALAVGALLFTLGFPGKRKFLALGALCVASLVGWQFAPSTFRDRMQSLTTVEEDYNYTSYAGRKQIWARGRGYIKQHPAFGVGVGNFPIAEGDYAASIGRPAKWSEPHNAYLQAFAELGLFGGGLFVALLITSARRAWRMWYSTRLLPAEWHRPEFLSAICAFAASGYFLSHAYFYPLFAICAMIALADRARVLERVRAPSGPQRPVVELTSGWRTARSIARARMKSA